MTDWAALNQQTAAFNSLTTTTDEVSGAVSIIYSGLEAKLTDVLAAAAGAQIASVTIYADTLTVDTDTVTAGGLVLVARSLDVSGIAGGALGLAAPSGGSAVAELLVGGVAGGAASLAQSPLPEGQAPAAVPAGMRPMSALVYSISPGAAPAAQVLTDAAYLQDLAGRVWALNSLKASYTAGAGLMDSDSADDRALAQQMFDWVVACAGTMALGGAAIPSDYLELYHQAGALLVTLNVAPGGYFVPVLSSDMYQGQIDGLLGALAGYEANLATLAVETGIAAAVAEVSSTLQGTAMDEMAPLQAQLSQIQDNIQALYKSIIVLRSDFDIQADQANTDYQNLAAAVALQELAQFLQDSISTAMSVISLGVAVAKGSEGDVGSVTDGMSALSGGVTSAMAAIDDLKMTPPGGEELVQQAKQLMQMQLALMTSFEAATILWAQSQQGGGGDPLPSALASVAVDPSLAWDNYVIQAQAVLTSVKENIGSGSDAQAAQDAANTYLASLEILAGYGKAIDGKFAAYSGQLAQATVVNAQIAAAKNVAARWQQQEAQAKSDEEKLAILRSIVQGRADALKRSIFVAWTYYRASFFYVQLTEPPVAINLAMTSAQMKDAFASVSTWVAQLLGTASDGQHIVLPNNDVEIAFAFAIRTAGDTSQTVAPGTDVALLTPAANGKPAQLAWTIPLGDSQLVGVLPENGDVAIWITEISFTIDGVEANQKGNVLVSVATSGTYENGFGPGQSYTFFSQGLVGEYGYSPGSGDIYIPWQIPTAVYMTPTPYTQWSMTFDPQGGDPSQATTLHMAMKVAYLASSG